MVGCVFWFVFEKHVFVEHPSIQGNILTLQIVEGREGVQLISQRRYFGCNWSNSGLDLGPTTLQTSPILALPSPPIIRVKAASSRGEERGEAR